MPGNFYQSTAHHTFTAGVVGIYFLAFFDVSRVGCYLVNDVSGQAIFKGPTVQEKFSPDQSNIYNLIRP
jgi:hypothetical protein